MHPAVASLTDSDVDTVSGLSTSRRGRSLGVVEFTASVWLCVRAERARRAEDSSGRSMVVGAAGISKWG